MVNLRDLGVRAYLFAGADIGICHLPLPVLRGDLALLAQAAFRVVAIVDALPAGAAIDMLAVVEPV
ncbi:MAG: hypothetical protein ACJ77E_21150 [Gaiellaceae bacterium]